MRLLIDSCAFLWMVRDPAKLSPNIRAILSNPENDVLFSTASIWELGIKWRIGRLELREAPRTYFLGAIERYSLTLVQVLHEHALLAAELPLHHKDPFDRMLIAQGIVERVPIASPVGHFGKYPVETVW